jgi:spoIIIJ-associated protein
MNLEEIKNQINDFLNQTVKLLGIGDKKIEVEVTEDEAELTVDIDIIGDNVDLLIGYRGKNISALHHILLLFSKKLAKQAKKKIVVNLDIGNYYSKQNEKVIKLATEAIEDVRLLQEPYEFQPMSPRMRRLIHMEIAKHADLRSESIGEGQDRRVVIHPNNAQS